MMTSGPEPAGLRPREEPMRDAVIVEAVRTPVGKRNGGLSTVHPVAWPALVLGPLPGCAVTGADPGRMNPLGGAIAPGRAAARDRAGRGGASWRAALRRLAGPRGHPGDRAARRRERHDRGELHQRDD